MQLHARHLRTETNLATHADNGTAQIFHHIPQNIRPNVRLLQIADFLGRTRRNERLDDLVHACIVRARR